MIPLNSVTAEPYLRLLLAAEGMEAGDYPFNRAWPVWGDFIALEPAADTETRATFQTLQYTYEVEAGEVVEELDVWSSDFPDLASFVAHLEALPVFAFAQDHSTLVIDLTMDEISGTGSIVTDDL